MDADIDTLLRFWFGPLDARGLCRESRNRLWFGGDSSTDQQCRAQFTELLTRARRGELMHWADNDEGLVALVVLLDQMSRNIHRGTPDAFAADGAALALAQAAIDGGRDRQLPPIHRVFLYLPLEHCENLQVQERCVALFQALSSETGDEQIKDFCRYALAHRDVIARFGRFPHRNRILGRDTTMEEHQYLEKHGGF